MRDWSLIAKGIGLEIPAPDLDRARKPLDSLEQAFRPLVQSLTTGMEPATAFQAEEDGE